MQVLQRHLLSALRLTEETLEQRRNPEAQTLLADIRTDYELMLDYMLKGFSDPQRETLYHRLLRRLYALLQDIDLSRRITDEGLYAGANQMANRRNLSNDLIRSVLEGFVADMAMLSLEEERPEARKELYQRHQSFMNRLFSALWTAPQWTDGDRRFYEELLLSPMIDLNDALLMTSAIMLAVMNLFDVNKLLTLIHVYRNATDEKLRQRALVGWALALPQDGSDLFPELDESLQQLTADKDVLTELLDMQKQVFFCMNAEKDHQQIQKDIMPTLMKNNNLQVTRFGIIEKEDDPMEDILHPDAADKRMEEMEEKIRQMMDMQKAGSDIFFGGFSQMKRFPFFVQMSNWFCPFYPQHPDLHDVNSRQEGGKLMALLFRNSPFCDSDKYSFALAIASIIDRLPQSVREMLGSDEALGSVQQLEEMRTPAFIRRSYLQDLYRFFRVFPQRQQLANPFEAHKTGDKCGGGSYLFLCSGLLATRAAARQQVALGWFLLQQQRWDDLHHLLQRLPDTVTGTADYHLLMAYSCMNEGRTALASECFQRVAALSPDDQRALRGLARTSMMTGRYQQAATAYEHLLQLAPGRKGYALNLCICRLKLQQTDEAVEELFRLHYEHPDDKNVQRVLAWGLLCQDKLEQARQEYESLLGDQPVKEDYLNAGYCQWLTGNIAKTVELFRCYADMDEGEGSLQAELDNDKALLQAHGISAVEVALVLDLVQSFPTQEGI